MSEKKKGWTSSPKAGDVVHLTEEHLPEGYEPGPHLMEKRLFSPSSTGMSAGDFFPSYTEYRFRPLNKAMEYDPNMESFKSTIAVDSWTGGDHIEGPVLVIGKMVMLWAWEGEEEDG